PHPRENSAAPRWHHSPGHIIGSRPLGALRGGDSRGQAMPPSAALANPRAARWSRAGTLMTHLVGTQIQIDVRSNYARMESGKTTSMLDRLSSLESTLNQPSPWHLRVVWLTMFPTRSMSIPVNPEPSYQGRLTP